MNTIQYSISEELYPLRASVSCATGISDDASASWDILVLDSFSFAALPFSFFDLVSVYFAIVSFDFMADWRT